jgi:hypothetical protein
VDKCYIVLHIIGCIQAFWGCLCVITYLFVSLELDGILEQFLFHYQVILFYISV